MMTAMTNASARVTSGTPAWLEGVEKRLEKVFVLKKVLIIFQPGKGAETDMAVWLYRDILNTWTVGNQHDVDQQRGGG